MCCIAGVMVATVLLILSSDKSLYIARGAASAAPFGLMALSLLLPCAIINPL